MNATQISTEIARLARLLTDAVRDDEFDGDIAAVLSNLATAHSAHEATLDAVTSFAENSDGFGWHTVASETAESAFRARCTSDSLRLAEECARGEQQQLDSAASVDAPTVRAGELRPRAHSVHAAGEFRRVLATDHHSQPGEVLVQLAGLRDAQIYDADALVPVAPTT